MNLKKTSEVEGKGKEKILHNGIFTKKNREATIVAPCITPKNQMKTIYI